MTNLPITGFFTITATYGQTGKYWSGGHKGIDIVCDNKNIYATCEGTVRVVTYDSNGWGQYVSIGDSDGNRHIFCHLKKGSVKVNVGDFVNRTTVIGTMGNTGNSTGTHLHFQLNDKKNTPIDPTKHLMIPNEKGTYNSDNYQIGEKKMAFKDENEISIWAKESVKKVSNLGLMNGVGEDMFAPKEPLTREQMAVVLNNLIEKGYIKK